MIYNIRIPIIFFSVLFLCIWLFLPFLRNNDQGYTAYDFEEDFCKVYYDLGCLSQKRNDFKQALKIYKVALSYNPRHPGCLKNIEICKKRLRNRH